jgi:cell division septal protein FtsQ
MIPAPLDLTEKTQPRPKKRWRIVAVVLLLALLAPTPWLARRGASRLAFFHVSRVTVDGTRYLSPDTVVAHLALDTLHSVWDDPAPLEDRVRALPQVADVSISRKLPGTLVVTVRENPPVALVPGGHGLEVVDSAGRVLPIDPAREALDLPVANQRDPALIRMLGQVRMRHSVLYRRISEVSRDARGDIIILLMANPTAPGQPATSRLPTTTSDSAGMSVDTATSIATSGPEMLRVRARAGVSATRLTDIFPVELDLRRRGARVAELDLRYRDQVIARLQ